MKMAKRYLIGICILMMGIGALSGCQDSMVTNDVVRDYDLFIRFQEASAKDFRNTYREEDLKYMLLHDFVIEPKYTQVGSFHGGLAPVSDEQGKWSYIDASGTIVWTDR